MFDCIGWIRILQIYQMQMVKRNEEIHLTQTELRAAYFLYTTRNSIENSPIRHVQTHKSRVNWEERDGELVAQIKQVIEGWDTQEQLTRITRTSVMKKINKVAWIQNHAKELPKSLAMLESMVESVEDFQIRRVKRAVSTLLAEHQEVKKWQIYKQANLRETISGKVKKFIDKQALNTV